MIKAFKNRGRQRGIGFLVAGIVIMLGMVGAMAAEAKKDIPKPMIAVVDVQRILQESLAAKSVQKQLESQRSKFQSKIESEENNLRQSEQELTKQRGQLPANTYADREQQLRQRFLDVERHVQGRRKILDQAFTDSMDAVRSGLLEIVEAVAHERGANMVVVKQQTLWIEPGLDITDEILARLNKKLPQVTVKMAPDDGQ